MQTDDTLQVQAMPLDPGVVEAFAQRRREPHVLVDPEFHIWDRSVITWHDGRYHAYYSRWRGEHRHWLTDSEVCHAIADAPEGPFEHTGLVLHQRNADGWDVIDSHSQYALVADGRVLLYYQSIDLRGRFNGVGPFPTREWLDDPDNRATICDRKRLGLAISDNPAGPFTRHAQPIITPDGCDRIRTIVDNPAVVYRDGRYLLILKSFDATRDKTWRIQMVAEAAAPDGPFRFHDEPVYAEKQTEDATVWYDHVSKHYYMACHVMGECALAMRTSSDGLSWQAAAQPVLMKKQFALSNGSVWQPERVEQPRVLTDASGLPVMLYVAVADKGVDGNIAVRLVAHR